MPFKDLASYVDVLERSGELIRVKEYVNPHLEATEIVDRLSKNKGPAVLFENTGFDFPLLMNSMGSEKRMCMALGIQNLDDVSKDIEDLLKLMTTPRANLLDKFMMLPKLGEISSWMPKVVSGRGRCQEVVMASPDINKLPIQKCWPEDGGPFLTLPIIHTKDPETGIRNVGLYRMQVFSPTMTAMHWHRHKVSARHFEVYKRLKKRMPVAVALGGDPVNTYVATAPLPEGIDEYMLAGFIRKKKVELVQCITQDVQVPADADFIIEGYIDPEEELILEGPFGDHTGYYSLPDFYPRFHITAITHKKNPIYPATIVGIPPQEDAWIGKATERIFLAPIRMMLIPEIVDMLMPVEGVFHNLVLVKIKKEYPGQALKVMNSVWGAGQMMFTKMIVILDGDVDLNDYEKVSQAISNNVDPARDIVFSQGPVDVLDHSCSAMAFGGKMGIDATHKLPEERAISQNGNIFKENPDFFEESFQVKIDSILQNLQQELPEIKSWNSALLKDRISVLFLAIEKNKKHQITELYNRLRKDSALAQIKCLIFLEHTLDVQDIPDVLWRFSNNLDPFRDHIVSKYESDEYPSQVGLDGTRKTKAFDDFERPWPNILVSDKATIGHIDSIWSKLGLGEIIPSPSLKYQQQLYKGGAAIEE